MNVVTEIIVHGGESLGILRAPKITISECNADGFGGIGRLDIDTKRAQDDAEQDDNPEADNGGDKQIHLALIIHSFNKEIKRAAAGRADSSARKELKRREDIFDGENDPDPDDDDKSPDRPFEPAFQVR